MANISVLQRLSALRNPGVVNAMIGLTQYRQQAIASQAQEQDQQDNANTKVTTTAEPDGRVFAHIENFPVTDAKSAGDEATSKLAEDLRSNVATYDALNARAHAGPPVVSTFGRTYGQSVARGGGLVRSLFAAAGSPPELSPESEAAAKYYRESVEPLLTPVLAESKAKEGEAKFNRLEFNDLLKNFSGNKETDLAMLDAKYPNAPPSLRTRAEAVSTKLGDEKEEKDFETFRKDPGLGGYATLQEAAAAYGKPLKLARTLQLSADWRKSHDQYQLGTTFEKQKIDNARVSNEIERGKLEQQRQALAFQQQLAKLNTPEAAQQSAEASLKDGNQYHMLEEKTPAQQAFKAQVAALIKKETGGRLPQQIKPGSPDAQRLETVYQGRQDVQWMRDQTTLFAKKGVDMAGAFRGRLLNAITEGKPSSVIARMAASEIPGFSQLSPADKQQYIETASTFYHRSLSLTAREVKSSMSGRPGEKIFEFFKSATPSLAKDPTVLQGLFNGADQEFNNAEHAVRKVQWGGEPPNAGTGNTGGVTETFIGKDGKIHIK